MTSTTRAVRRAPAHRATTPPRRRRAAALSLVLALLAAGAVTLAPAPAEAAITTAFEPRFRANTNGDIALRGNTLMTCVAATACTTAENRGSGVSLNNNDYSMRFVDVDANPATRSSSRATVTIPAAGSVLFAGLYWSAYTTGPTAPPAGTAPNRLLLQAPGTSGYSTITASQVSTTTAGAGTSYQAFADVTSVVAGARSGTYTAADIHAAQGADRYGAWTLVVAYTDPALPARNLTVFDGYGVVQNSPASDRTLAIPVAGFATPPVGTFTTRLGAVTYEGDAGLTGDTFTITDSSGTTRSLSNALNPADNAFNSTVSDAGSAVTGRTPSQTNTFGYDADVFSGQLVSAGSTSATLRLATGGETFYPGVVTFATELFAPTLVAEKTQTVQDRDGNGVIGPGDRIDYAVAVRNTGRDAAVQSVLADPLPVGTQLVPGSIRVDGAAVSDAADADRGELVDGSVSVRLGTNPGTTGGRLPVGASTTVTFTVDVVGSELADGAQVVNRAAVRYRGEQVGQSLSGTSNVVAQQFTAPRSDLRVTKTADQAVVQSDGTRALTWTATVVNDGPAPDAGVTFTDELPDGFTPATLSGPGCVVTGSTVSCDVGPMAVGATATVVVTGTVDAATTGALSNTATATGLSVDPTPATSTSTVAVNRPPVAVDDTAAVAGGAGSQVTIPVLDDDTDPDGDPLTVPSVTVTPPAHGTVQVQPDGSLLYTVTDPTFRGTETLTYTVCDDRGGCDTGTVTIEVGNQAPVAVDDTAATPTGTPVTVDVLSDDSDPNGDPLTLTQVTQPAGGTATVVGNQVVVTPDPDFEGLLTVEYTVCDDGTPPLCDTATLVVTVDNAAPTANDDAFTTPFQTPLLITPGQLLTNDTDPNGADTLSVTAVGGAVGGTVVRDPATGEITFTLASGFTGTASFTYTITDGTASDTATVLITVPDTAPIAGDDAVTVPGGGAQVPIEVLANDTDAETPDDLTVTVVGAPTNGSVVVDGGEIVYYAADPAFKGTDTFEYQVCDPQGLCDTATVTVTVQNQAPVATDDVRTARPGETVQIPVLLNDTDPNGDALTLTRVVTPPGQGTATVDPVTGLLSYTPAPGQTAPVTLTYEVCDDDAPTPACGTATVTISVVNTPPEAHRDAAFAFHGAGRPTVVPIDVLANDTDPDGEPLAITGVAQPLTGSAAVVDGQIVYTAPAGFVGQVTFSYEIADPSGGTSQSTVLVTIGNKAPLAANDALRMEAGRSATVDVLANDSDPDGDPLSIRLGTPSGGGTAQVVGGQVVFTSDGTLGTFTVPYEACDPYGACEPAVLVVEVVQRPTSDLRVTKAADPAVVQSDGDRSVTFTVVVVNDGPAADPAVVVTDELPVGFTASGVTGPGCALADGTITCAVGALAVGASAVVTVTGGVDAGVTGSVTNTATAAGDSVDPSPASGSATVAVNRPPVAADDTATVTGGAGSQVTIPVLDDDTDPDGDPLTVPSVTVTPPAHGTVQVQPDGSLLYTVTDPTFRGTETLTYTVCDDRGGCDTATVTIEVANQAPLASDDSTGTAPDTAVTVDVVADDVDPNGDPLTVTAVTQPTGGTATVVGNQVVVTPDPGFEGELVVEYTVCDDGEPPLCDTATLTVLVDEAAPVARDDRVSTPFQTPLTLQPSDLLANDSDPNPGDALTVVGVADGTGGTVVRDPATGEITFTPAAGFTGTATFTYTISDGAVTASATVYVAVPNTAPVAGDDAVTVPGGSAQVVVDVLANDTDAETPDDLAVTVVGAPTNGSVVVDGGEIVYYAADPAFKGTDTFEYQVCDPQGLCDTATVTVTVQNQAPAAQDDSRTVRPGETVEVPVLTNDSDPNGDVLTLTRVVTPPAHGTVSVDPATGLLSFTPATGRFDPVTITYEVCDDDPVPACTTAVVTVTVAGGPPVAVDDSRQVAAGGSVTVDVLANDSDPDGDPLTVVLGTPSGGGTAQLVGGQVVFTSDGTPGTFTVPYRACEPSGACADAVLTIEVLPEPAVLPSFDSRPENVRQVVTVGDGIAPVVATSPDGSPLTYAVVDGDLPPGLTLNPDGTFSGTTTTVGTTVVTIEACTADGRCAQTRLTVVVLPRAVPPTTPAPPGAPGFPGDPDDPDAGPGRDGRLPRTGAEVGPLLGLAVLMVLSGTLAVRLRRREG